MQIVRNNHTQPVTLADGTILAAAGTNGSTKSVSLPDPSTDEGKALADQMAKQMTKLVRRGFINVREQELQAVQSPKAPAKLQSEPAKEKE